MNPLKSTFVTACQQLLTLAVVLAVLAPAAGVVSLDVVPPGSGTTSATAADPAASFAAYVKASTEPSVLPAEEVEATVIEHPLTAPEAPAAARRATPEVEAEEAESANGTVTVTSTPQDVEGFGAVGVTWDSDAELAEDEITLRARTRENGQWSEWTELIYHDEHGPDPGTPEAAGARPGTDELLVGEVDEVQVQATAAAEALPTDMKLAVVAPGEVASTETDGPAIDTATMPAAPAAAGVAPQSSTEEAPEAEAPGAETPATDGLALQAASYAPRPTIYSRAQWGANEKLRDKGSLRYGTISAGFVHHTVNGNDYTRDEVPGILRSIYAYHTKSRGWSDVGYNFLVDRFGRIWEGRAGGVDKPVVGAHTLGYNDYSFAMSAIGNFETATTTSALVQAYGSLMAWKLSLHGVSASDTSQKVGRKYFPAISGHRDAGSTACPGRYLYAKLGRIRKLAAAAQRTPATQPPPPAPPAPAPQPTMNLADTAHPDLIVRRTSDKRLFVLPTRGLTSFATRSVQGGWGKYTAAVASPDLNGDGRVDMIVQNRKGTVAVRPGTASGAFGGPLKGTRKFRRTSMITGIGDLNGDRRNDAVALHRASGRLHLYLGRGNGTFKRKRLAKGWSKYDQLAASGDLNGDRRVDLVARDPAGNVWLHPGKGRRFGKRVLVARGWQGYRTITGFGDFTQDGHNDLVGQKPNGKTFVLPGTGRGTFGPKVRAGGGTKGVAGLSGGGSVAGTADADLLGRRGGSLVVVQHAGTTELGRYIDTGQTAADARQVLNAGDWDRDGDSDVLVVTQAGLLRIMYNDGSGRLSAPQTISSGFGTVRLLAAVGDVSGDGLPDLMGQPAGGGMMTWPGAGTAGLDASYPAHPAVSGSVQIGVGQWDGTGAPDTLVRGSDRFTLYSGKVPGTLTAARALTGSLRRYNWVIGVGDVGLGAGPDVIVRRKRSGALYVLSGSSSGLGSRRYLGGGMNAFDLAD